MVLTAERLQHIPEGHPELDAPALVPHLVEAVESPYDIHYGYGPDEEWFYVKGGPSLWIKVVVRFDEGERGRIITAFPRRSKP